MVNVHSKSESLRKGIEAAKAGNYLVARLKLTMAADEQPQNPLVWIWRAWVAEKPEQAIEMLNQCLAIQPTDPIARSALAWVEFLRAYNPAEMSAPMVISDHPPAQTHSMPIAQSMPISQTMQAQSLPIAASMQASATSSMPAQSTAAGLLYDIATPDSALAPKSVVIGQLAENRPRNASAFINDILAQPVEESMQYGALPQASTGAGSLASPTQNPQNIDSAFDQSKQLSALMYARSNESLPPSPSMTKDALLSLAAKSASAVSMRPPAASPPPPPTSGTESNVGVGKSVLVVDDSYTVRKVVEMTLKAHGFHVVLSSDGVDAISQLVNWLPDLILLDISMPNLDGYKTCRLIKNEAKTKSIPVVMLSGKDGVFDRFRARMSGCNDFLTKPFNSDELVAKVAGYTGVEMPQAASPAAAAH